MTCDNSSNNFRQRDTAENGNKRDRRDRRDRRDKRDMTNLLDKVGSNTFPGWQ